MNDNAPTPTAAQREYIETTRYSIAHVEMLPHGDVGLLLHAGNISPVLRLVRADVLALADLIRESEAR